MKLKEQPDGPGLEPGQQGPRCANTERPEYDCASPPYPIRDRGVEGEMA